MKWVVRLEVVKATLVKMCTNTFYFTSVALIDNNMAANRCYSEKEMESCHHIVTVGTLPICIRWLDNPGKPLTIDDSIIRMNVRCEVSVPCSLGLKVREPFKYSTNCQPSLLYLDIYNLVLLYF